MTGAAKGMAASTAGFLSRRGLLASAGGGAATTWAVRPVEGPCVGSIGEADRPASYEELYRLHHARVVRLCRLLLRDAAEAEDTAQEVFTTLFRVHATETRAMAWGPWLTRVAVNACHHRHRSRRWTWWRLGGEELDESRTADGAASPEDDAVSAEDRRRLQAAFLRLSQRQREIFVLRHVEGWSTQEVADGLGVSAGTVKLHLFRANRAFRKALGDRS
jgi:RNA polymerase sigma-70 factor (ECF subfamily)